MASRISPAIDIFRDWFNNYITTEVMAEHYGCNKEWLETRIEQGRKDHNLEARAMRLAV
jgi:hypothetical protein